jgi:hypothetical protein
MAKSRTSLTNRATRILYKNAVDAKWYDGPTCTETSPFLHICSDIITSTYDFLLEDDSTNLLQALKALKHSKHVVPDRSISADEYTFVPMYKMKFKISIALSDDKKEIKTKLYIKDSNGKTKHLSKLSILDRTKLTGLRKRLIKLEEDYKTL